MHDISVCLQIYMNTRRNINDAELFDTKWSLGSCYGPKFGWKWAHFYDRCCLPEGQYTLTCRNTKSKYGWGNVAIEINGKRYCDDFVGFKAMRIISIEGRSLYLSLNSRFIDHR